MLEKVIIAIEKRPKQEERESFFQMLDGEGIGSVCLDVKEESFVQKDPLLYGMRLYEKEKLLGKCISKEGVLWISDRADLCRNALAEGYPVIAYLGGRTNRQAEEEMQKTDGENRESAESAEDSFWGVRYAVESLKGIDGQYLERACRRYAGLPWEILQTKRCIVRETTVEDVDAFYKIYEEPSITEYMEGLFEDREEEIRYTKNYIKSVYEFFGYGLWTIVEKNDNCVIGRAGISWREDTETIELGFVIARPYQRKGYAFEVCSAILDYAYDGLDIRKVWAYVDKENQISQSLCHKLGFRFRGETCLRNGFGKEETVDGYVWER